MIEKNEKINGFLDRIVFQNDTGFIIANFYNQKNKKNFIAIGSLINPQINMEYALDGYYVIDHKYGEQFKFSSYETNIPIDPMGIFKYITKICKFVGPAVGNDIVDKYGDKTLEIMKTDPERLASDISGLTIDRAKEIQTTLMENEATEKIMVELEIMLDVPGMRKSLPGELIKAYKSNAAEQIKVNPYILTRFHGVGFPLADRVALNIGYARDSIERKEAATMHCLKQNMQEGSIWISIEDLVKRIQELIQVPELSGGVFSLIDQKIIVEESKCVALANPAADEEFIADVIASMGVVA
jgi:exodeoxyribonuclease V alpha subunit